MILAEKIMMLRKKSGWSQEELAEQLGISRQSVSKWESGASIPDLDKIIKMSSLFGVSTDYLLKDDLETITYSETDDDPVQARSISVEEANTYMEETAKFAKKLAPAVAMCILSPIALIYLGGVSEYKGTITENLAGGLGTAILLVIIALAVGFMIVSGLHMGQYDYLEKEVFTLQYGVHGIVEKKKKAYEKTFYTGIAIGTMCCILGVVPLIVVGGMLEDSLPTVACVCVLLAMVALGVFFFIRVSVVYGSFEKLLQTGEYSEEEKVLSKKFERRWGFVPGVYWCVVTAIYLAYSFVTNNWDYSWIVWPVAGVAFAAIMGVLKGKLKKEEQD